MSVQDYPDWTDLVQLVGTDIMLPIDIQGAYIMMPIDIQAQYIDLDVAITADNIEAIMIALTAEEMGDIKIDIKTQSIEHFEIEINAQNVAMYIGAEWGSLKNKDKILGCHGADKTFGAYAYVEWEVAGCAAYHITQMSFYCYPFVAADGDKNNFAEVALQKDFSPLSYLGGNGGGSTHFPSPIKVVAGETVKLYIYNRSNHDVTLGASIAGYEV